MFQNRDNKIKLNAEYKQMVSSYIEIFDNIEGKGCNLDEWNTSYGGCKCKNNNEIQIRNTNDGARLRLDQNFDYHNEQLNNKNNKNLLLNDNNNNKKICSDKFCTCIIVPSNQQSNYNEYGRLDLNNRDDDLRSFMYPIIECSSYCECNEEYCFNRIVQKGCKFKLEVFDSDFKGKGVRAKEFIPKGSFVIEYLGEIIGLEEAEMLFTKRSELNEPNYIMFLKESFAIDKTVKTTIIDARNYSNKARFINHSCEPNLVLMPVYINNLIPHAALFALEDINMDEEVSYDYNGSIGPYKKNEKYFDSNKLSDINKIVCYCKSIKCRGYLPNQT